jgi:hypothetical protein
MKDGMNGKILQKLIELFSELQSKDGMAKPEQEMEMEIEPGGEQKGKVEMLSIEAKPKGDFDKMKGC